MQRADIQVHSHEPKQVHSQGTADPDGVVARLLEDARRAESRGLVLVPLSTIVARAADAD